MADHKGKRHHSRWVSFRFFINTPCLFLVFLLLLGVSSLNVPDGCASPPVNVLLINAYHPGYRWSDELVRGFRETLMTAEPQTQLFVEYLDSKRIYSPSALDRLADLVQEKYRHTAFDAVIAADNNSFSFLKQHRQSLFSGIPAIFCGANDLNPADLDGMAPITGVNEAADVRETLDEALILFPSTRRVVVVNDTTPTGRNVHKEIERIAAIYRDRLVFSYWEDLRRDDLLHRLAGLKNGDIVLYTFFFRDTAGRFYEYDDSAQSICDASPVPVFGLWEFNLGLGIVGGKLVSGYEQGHAAGKMALQILAGKKADEIAIQMKSPNRFAFDYRVLEKFGIDESRLPAQSLIINRPVSIYQEYKAVIWSTLLALVALASLSLFLMANIAARRRVEKRLRKSQQFITGVTSNVPGVVYQFYATADGKFGLNFVSGKVFEIFELDVPTEEFFSEFSACVHKDDQAPFFESIINAVKHVSPWHFEGRFVKPSGETIWFSGNSIPHREDTTIVFDGVIMDISGIKAAEEKLRKSERQMSQIINFLPDPTFVIDRKSRVIAWNRAMENLTGIKAEAMLGKGNYEYAIPFYGERRPVMIDLVGSWNDLIANQYKDIKKKDDLLFSETLEPHRPLGNRHFRNTAGPLYDENDSVVGAIETIHDITERRHAETRMQLMDHVVQNSPVVLFRWQATENWPVVYVTDNVKQFGYTREELLSGKVPFSVMIHPDDRSRVAEEVMAYSRQGVFDFKQEYRIVTKDGAVRWIDDRTVVERDGRGTITHYQGVVLDITDRKSAQEEISKRQLYLESVLYHAPDAIITLDARHRVVDWNPGAEKIFGYTSQEARGKELDGLVTRDEVRVEAGGKTRRVLSGERVEAFETIRFRKDGTPVHVIAGGSPIMVDGTLTGVVAMYTDVTALKQAQDDVRRSERMLRRIMDIVPSMIFVRNARGRFLMVNQAVAEAYGMAVEELISMSHESVHPDPVQVQGYLADDREALESGRPLFVSEEPFQDHTGALRWLEVIKIPGDADDFGEPVIVGLATDITERRAVEARIQESEKRYRTMFENTGTGTVLSEADTTLSMVNSEFASMVGYSREAIEGKMSWTQFIVPEDVGRMKAYHFARREDPSSAPTQWECSLVDRSGTVKQMLLKVRLIPGTQTSIGSFLDITERKRAEEDLVEANRMLRLILDTIPVRVFWKDRECHYLGCNQAFAGDAGHSEPEALIGKDDYEMTWRDQADLYRKDDQAVIASGIARINYEEPQTTPEGHTIWLQTSKVPIRDNQENIIGLLGTYQDITERKNAVEELRKLRNYLTNIINSMPSVLVGVDTRGRVTQWNKQAELATGMTFDQARSQPLTAVFPQLIDEMDRIQSAIQDRRVLRDPKIPRHSKGETRFEDVTIFPLVANGVEGAVIRVDDVTERVRLEEMMIQSEKMLSVGGLAAGMAHEINNPLAGILQNTAVLDNRLLGDLPANRQAAEAAGTTMAAIRHYLELRKLPVMLDNIRSSGKRAAAIVRNMLSFARKSDRSVSSHDLGALLEQTVELAQTDYDMKKRYDFKQIHIVREFDSAVPPVPCEASKLQQVFLNILKNGAEAMADVVDRRVQPTFTLRVNDDGFWVRVEIEDNGPGMDANTRRRIFEPFFTTKPVGKGTGLGLSVSYFIITENHGGKMDVFSANGEGTRFVIRLPKAGKP
ncbi:MAG: PAS domain S-box protein [Deltaproteobacteria bacterium]|nr:PAS domain S-box protein [Deltaproteobacteria bacterium]